MPLTGKRLLVVSADDGLARVVAAASARTGASVVVCPDARAALEQLERTGADGAILDLPVPDLRPDALLLTMRRYGVKTVAVSGVIRADRYATTAVRFGAEKFLEKPFEVQEALAALEAALAAAPAAAAAAPTPLPDRAAAPPAHALASRAAAGLAVVEVGGSTPDAPTSWTSNPLFSNLTPALTPLPALPPEPEVTDDFPLADDLDSYIFSAPRPFLDETLPGIPLARPREGLAAPLPPTTAPAARKRGAPKFPVGDLAASNVARVLAALHVAKVTGSLTLEKRPQKKLILLEDGRPVFAASNLPSERFGARCVREGILSAEALQALAASIGARQPLNEALLARGLIDADQRARMFAAQIRDIIWGSFEWKEGTYLLVTGPRARRPIAPTDLRTGDLVLEGFRRAVGLERLREELPGSLALAHADAPPFDLRELTVSEPEARMLAHADGTKTVADLVVLSGVDERNALAFLAGCKALGLLDEVSRSLAGTGRIGFM